MPVQFLGIKSPSSPSSPLPQQDPTTSPKARNGGHAWGNTCPMALQADLLMTPLVACAGGQWVVHTLTGPVMSWED